MVGDIFHEAIDSMLDSNQQNSHDHDDLVPI